MLDASLVTVYGIALTYAALSVPFIFSGIVVSIALTRFPRQVSALYAADLAGAALGCVIVGPMLQLTDAPTAVLATAAAAAAGAWLFATVAGRDVQPGDRGFSVARGRLQLGCAGLAVLLTVVAGAHAAAARQNASWLRLVWVKGQYEPRPLVESWNSFSRIRVIGDPDKWVKPSGWGLSTTLPADRRAHELHLDIDSYAGTELTRFSGNPADVEHLRYDVTNVVHYLRPVVARHCRRHRRRSRRAFVARLRPEGGHRRGDQRGDHRARERPVRRFHRPPRSRPAGQVRQRRSSAATSPGSNDRADIIQISLIDTWAATASGAFVLDRELAVHGRRLAVFLDHLAPHGILTVSRWYYANQPGEVYRLASLASTTLMAMGVRRPGDHFAIVRARPGGADAPDGIGTMLVSRDPLSAADLDALESVAARMKFEIVQSPRHSADDTFAALADGDATDGARSRTIR